MIQENIPWNGK